jgi:hypothetical protein
MATIGLRNRRLRDSQCTVRDSKSRALAVHVVPWPRPSGSNVSIGTLSHMQNEPPCTAMTRPTEHCPHRRIFQVIFGNRDRGELGGFPLQGMFLIVYTCHTKP